MSRRTSLGEYALAALALLAVSNLAGTALGEQVWMKAGTDAPFDISLVTVQAVDPAVEPSSVEEGQTSLDEAFDWRQWRLEKRRGALKDTKFEFNLRTYYLNRHQFSGDESQAWALGGWAGLKTGYFLGHVAFGVTGYTSQRLYGPEDKDGTDLLEPGQESYTVLGEAYADIRIADGYNVFIGLKGYDTPFINRDDTRMTPNTFEAIVFQGRTELGRSDAKPGKNVVAPVPDKDVAVIKYGLGYFDQIKKRNSDEFVPMSVAAGATAERGVYTAGVLYQKGDFSIGAIDYFSPDIINIGYAETKLKIPLSKDWRPAVAAQFVDQRSAGDDLLQGDSFSGQQFGLKVDLPVKKALFTVAYTQATNGTNMQTPWSGYPGYTSVQVQDFNRAGEGAFLLRAGYDFPCLEGLSAYALAVLGTTPSAAGQYRQNEYDVNLQWVPPKGVLKGLSLRVRYALVHQYGGDVDDLTDFRVIGNYMINF